MAVREEDGPARPGLESRFAPTASPAPGPTAARVACSSHSPAGTAPTSATATAARGPLAPPRARFSHARVADELARLYAP